jgi:murein DD-endopeptidase
MKLNWKAVFENEKKEFDQMSEAKKFAYFLMLQYNAPYGWGKENPESSDCSGAVCLALAAATGKFIRVTADDLLKKVFTVKYPPPGTIRAAFFIDRKLDRAVHCAGFVDEGIVLNSQEGGARLRDFDSISAWFFNRDQPCKVRGLDKAALEKLAGIKYGLDRELEKYILEV